MNKDLLFFHRFLKGMVERQKETSKKDPCHFNTGVLAGLTNTLAQFEETFLILKDIEADSKKESVG